MRTAIFKAWPFSPLLAFAIMSSPCLASEENIVVAKTSLATHSQLVPELHVFGGNPVDLDLEIEGPIGGHGTLEALLSVIASSLAAPLAPASSLGELQFDDQKHLVLKTSLYVPTVKQKTEMLVQFQVRIGATARPAGTARLFVYPENLAAPLKALATQMEKGFGGRIGVFGKSQALRVFFKRGDINFEDLGEDLPASNSPKMLYIGEAPPSAIADWLRTRRAGTPFHLVVFTTDPWLLPGVYFSTSPNGGICKVTLSVLENLIADPLCQVSLVNILTQNELTAAPSDSL